MADITLSSWSVLLITALILPFVVGLLTKINAPAGVKIVVNIVVSAVASLLVANADALGGAVISRSTLNMWIVTTLVSVLSYVGLYKPVDGVAKLPGSSKGLG